MDTLKMKKVIDWIITSDCPLRCEHCIISKLVYNSKSIKDEELTTLECKELIDFLYDQGARALSITGGEALTRNDLFEIIDYGRAKGMKVFLYTTGLSFINLKTEKLQSERVQQVLSRIDFLGISLDTFHDDAHHQIKPRDYCEILVRLLIGYAAKNFPNLQIQLFTVIGRKDVATVEDVVADCSYLAGIINTIASEVKTPIRWRLSPFRFNPDSMQWWQRQLLFSPEEIQQIEQKLKKQFGDNSNFSMNFGVDYDSLFVYPDGKFRTVQLDENGVDRFVELGTFRNRVITHPEIWNELYEKDGQTAKRMNRTDILKL